jgi:hypothetical protein
VFSFYTRQKPMKMTRKQAREALQSIPIEQIILGGVEAPETRLTPKQKEFARQLALGETKAGAYRKSRETKAKPETASKRGQALAKLGAVQAQVEAFRAAIEAQKYATPTHLRALVIEQLTRHALDAEFPPAQRIKALELLGRITEVAAFTERREVVHVHDAETARERLMQSLRLAINSSAIDVTDTSADDLLAEISGAHDAQAHDIITDADADARADADPPAGEGFENAPDADPPAGGSLDLATTAPSPLHSIPHTQSPQNSEPTPYINGSPDSPEGGV